MMKASQRKQQAAPRARRSGRGKGAAPAKAPLRAIVRKGYGVQQVKGGLVNAAGSELPCFFGIESAAHKLGADLAPVIGPCAIVPLRVTIERLKGGASK